MKRSVIKVYLFDVIQLSFLNPTVTSENDNLDFAMLHQGYCTPKFVVRNVGAKQLDFGAFVSESALLDATAVSRFIYRNSSGNICFESNPI